MSTENLPQSPEQPPRKPRVAVVFGGRSSEHGISVVTAGAVLRAIDRTKYDVLPIGITQDGRWALTADEPERMAIADRQAPNVDQLAESERGRRGPPRRPVEPRSRLQRAGIGAQGPRRGRRRLPGAARPLRRGRHPPGPAGALRCPVRRRGRARLGRRPGQGVHEAGVHLLRAHGRPVRGDPAARVGARRVGGPQEDRRLRRRARLAAVREARARGIVDRHHQGRRPVRPRRGDRRGPAPRPEDHRRGALRGREIECGVLEFEDGPRASVPAEIPPVQAHAFYDFEAKYIDSAAGIVPAPLTEEQTARSSGSRSRPSTRRPARASSARTSSSPRTASS